MRLLSIVFAEYSDIYMYALLNNKRIADAYGKLKIRFIEEANGDRALWAVQFLTLVNGAQTE